MAKKGEIVPRFFKVKLLDGTICWARAVSSDIAESHGREFKVKEVNNSPCERGWYGFIEV